FISIFFFFQAEDGIRDFHVTGVQTCALPISRGANGVVIITTKRGKAGKNNIGFSLSKSYSNAPKKWKTLTAEQESILQNETWINDGKDFSKRPFRSVSEGGKGNPEDLTTYDRIGLIFQTAESENVDLSMSGGNEKTQYYLGG